MKYYHNNRCRKSREGLIFLEERNIKPQIIEYINSNLNEAEIELILNRLNYKAIELIRKNESVYKDNIKGKNLSEVELIKWMVKEPKLMERPILVNGNKAIIGRPTEKFLEII
jgi:arsenate reductase